MIDQAIEQGKKIARQTFAKRGNHSEIHLGECELATLLAAGYLVGKQSGNASEEMYAALTNLLALVESNVPDIGYYTEHPSITDARAALTKADGKL